MRPASREDLREGHADVPGADDRDVVRRGLGRVGGSRTVVVSGVVTARNATGGGWPCNTLSQAGRAGRVDTPRGRRDTRRVEGPGADGATSASGAAGAPRRGRAVLRAAAARALAARPAPGGAEARLDPVRRPRGVHGGVRRRRPRGRPRRAERAIHAAARERIEAYGGVVEKFIGDAVMAVFGAPVAHGDDAERAVRAGLRVLDAVDGARCAGALARRARGREHGRGDRHVGAAERGEALAIGDVVNTASRLQSAAPTGRLVVGAETQRATRHAIEYEALPAVDAKGKAEPVEAWLAVRVALGALGAAGAAGPFVGRARELDVIRSVWRQATADRRPHVVTVVGAPGHRQVASRPRDRGRGRGGAGPRAPRPLRAVRGADRLPRVRAARAAGVRDLRLRPRAGRAGQARGRASPRCCPRAEAAGHGALPRAAPRARHGCAGRRPSGSSSSRCGG